MFGSSITMTGKGGAPGILRSSTGTSTLCHSSGTWRILRAGAAPKKLKRLRALKNTTWATPLQHTEQSLAPNVFGAMPSPARPSACVSFVRFIRDVVIFCCGLEGDTPLPRRRRPRRARAPRSRRHGPALPFFLLFFLGPTEQRPWPTVPARGFRG